MKATTDQEQKQSRYLSAGSPLSCFLPSCRKPFEGSCIRGNDGHFYCSFACAEVGGKLDLDRVEDLNSKTPKQLPTPRQRLLGGRS